MTSPVGRAGRLRLEPWGVEHAGSWQDVGDADQLEPGDVLTEAAVAIEVPLSDWRGLRPTRPAPIERVLFLDGVRRLEARAMLDEPGRQRFAALGSCAVGAVECRPGSGAKAREVGDPLVERWCVIAGGGEGEPDLELASAPAAPRLSYRTVVADGDDHAAPVEELQRRMRAAEARLASTLRRELAAQAAADPVNGGSLLVCDGPRPNLGPDERVVGYLKSVQHQRLPAAAFDVVRRLEEGERSPVYLVGAGAYARFEWYVRLRDPRPWLHSLAGSARLQAHAGEHPHDLLEAAAMVADWSALNLPRFATRAHQDARAPQQLLPVRALESSLRRRLGSAPLLRRRVEAALAQAGGRP